MGAIVDSIMLGTTADEDRFRTVIDAAIESKEVSSFSAFQKAAKTSAGSKKSAAKRKAKVDKVTAPQLILYTTHDAIRVWRFDAIQRSRM